MIVDEEEDESYHPTALFKRKAIVGALKSDDLCRCIIIIIKQIIKMESTCLVIPIILKSQT